MEDDLIKEDTLFFTIDNNKISFEDENEDSIYMQKKDIKSERKKIKKPHVVQEIKERNTESFIRK